MNSLSMIYDSAKKWSFIALRLSLSRRSDLYGLYGELFAPFGGLENKKNEFFELKKNMTKSRNILTWMKYLCGITTFYKMTIKITTRNITICKQMFLAEY